MEKTISKKDLREFGFLIAIAFPVLIGWIIPLINGHEFRLWTLWVSVIGLTCGLITPYTLLYPFKVWIMIGDILGWFNSHIVLGLVFWLILQPIALILKIRGYDPLRKLRKGKNTYRENRGHNQIDLTRIF